MNAIGRALQFFRPDAHRLALILFLLLASVGATVLKPWPLAWLVDVAVDVTPTPAWLESMSGGDRPRLLALLAGSLFGLHLVQGGLAMAQYRVAMQVGLNAVRRARDEVFACLLRLTSRFLAGARSNDLARRATADTCAFHSFLHDGVVSTLSAVLTLVLMIVVLWRVNTVLTLVTLMGIPMLLATMKYFGRGREDRAAGAQSAESQVGSFVQQSIVTLPLTQASGREEHEAAAFSARTVAAMQRREAQLGWDLGYWLVIAVVFAVITAGLSWLGSKQVMAGKLTVGEWLVFLAYLPLFYEPLRQLATAGPRVQEAIAGTGRVFEILDTAEEIRESPRARPVSVATGGTAAGIKPTPPTEGGGRSRATVHVSGQVEFDGVSFAIQREPLLTDLRLQVPAGQSVAILGASGPGKAALLHLLARFYDPTAGCVRVEGVDLRELRLREWRMALAVVPAEPILLPATLVENIAYAKPRARRSDVEAAARAARADQFIEKLPNKYLTTIGEGGVRLSPGERHRLNLARAFLKNAPIVVMEEPATEMDGESEALAQEGLKELLRGRTAFIVANRRATVQMVDRVMVLRDGKLVEESPAAGGEIAGYQFAS
jgi:ATP-binding cassette subfamily B protein